MLQENNWVTTEDGDDHDLQSRERLSEVIEDFRHIKEMPSEIEEDKESMDDKNSEMLALKSSSTEYNFYNSDESRGQSILSSNSSNFQQFKNQNKYNGSLKVVKEVSNTAIEEDPDEDIKTSKENSSGQVKDDVERRDDETVQVQQEISKLSLNADVSKIVDFMKDLIQRCKMVYSFYEERKTQELIIQYEIEMAYLLNKIWYELKTFITTFSNSNDNKNSATIQIISDTNEKIEITEEIVKLLKTDAEYKSMKQPIVELFLVISEQIAKTHEYINKMDKNFQQTLACNLLKFAFDIVEEAVVLDESDLKDQAVHKYTQAQFILDELLCEYYKAQQLDIKDDIKNCQSNNGSQCDNSEVIKSSRSMKCRSSISVLSHNEYTFDFHDIKEDEIDKIYTIITRRINRVQN